MNHQCSDRLFQMTSTIVPGGVNNPARSFHQVGGTPVFMRQGQGPYLWDEDSF